MLSILPYPQWLKQNVLAAIPVVMIAKRSGLKSNSPEACSMIALLGRHRSERMSLPMLKIKPLEALVLAASRPCQSALPFDIKVRAWVAIFIGERNILRRSNQTPGQQPLIVQPTSSAGKTKPPTGAIVDRPIIKNLKLSASHTWASA